MRAIGWLYCIARRSRVQYSQTWRRAARKAARCGESTDKSEHGVSRTRGEQSNTPLQEYPKGICRKVGGTILGIHRHLCAFLRAVLRYIVEPLKGGN
jgi:hypothetical protein